MQIDELFDFLTDRVSTPPPFWYNHEECPHTVTGGYVAINMPYEGFSKLRSVRDWEDPFQTNYQAFRQELEQTSFEEWDTTLEDGLNPNDWHSPTDDK